MSHDFEEKLYQDITDVGGFAMAKAVKTWHHQELQKAREEERKIIKLRINYDRRKGIPAEETVNDIYDSIELKDQSELDQPNK